MLYNFDQVLIPSFILWVDNFLCNEGQAYTNTGGPLYSVVNSLKGLQTNFYSSPFRPWVADSSVSGAYIPSGAYFQNTFIPRGTSGFGIDFQNGQVFMNSQVSGLTGSYSVKDYCIKYTSLPEENLLFNTQYNFIPRYTFNQPTTGLTDNDVTLPVIFVKYDEGIQDAVQLGEGIVNTLSTFRCIILSEDAGLMENILGRIRDKNRSYFSVFNPSQLPFNYMGDIKNGNYNYLNLVNDQIGYSYVSSARSAKFPEIINLDIGRNVFGGYVDLTIETYRNPDAIF